MSKESPSAGGAQGCPIFSLRLSPAAPARFHTLIGFHRGIPQAADNPFKFAHLSGDGSSTFGWDDVTLSTMNPVWNLTNRSNLYESVAAVNPLCSMRRRRVLGENGTDASST